jgi:hypothetical protein
MNREEIIEAMFAEYEKHQTGTDRMVAALKAAIPYIAEECAKTASAAEDPAKCKFMWAGCQSAAQAIRGMKWKF